MKKKGFLFYLVLILISWFLLSCEPKNKALTSLREFKDSLTEKIKVSLSNLPFINRYIKLPPEPKELYKKVEEKISLLKLSKAKDLYPQEYQRILKDWQKTQFYYKNKYYLSAKKKLEELDKASEDLWKKVEDYNKNLKEKALLKYKQMEEILLNKAQSLGEKVKVNLYLLKLKNLIDLGRYDELEREMENPPF